MNVFTQFRINSPQVQLNIDRNKAKAIGISLSDIFDTLEVQLASLYVNNFTYLNRSWQVERAGRGTLPQPRLVAGEPLRQLGIGGKQHSDRHESLCHRRPRVLRRRAPTQRAPS